jgi:hypothetical protein
VWFPSAACISQRRQNMQSAQHLTNAICNQVMSCCQCTRAQSSKPWLCRFNRPFPNTIMNPLQDLVNDVANASGSSRHQGRGTLAADRYASAPVLASLQVDDSVNLGSQQPSPAVALKAPLMPGLSVVDQSYVTTGAGALGCAPLMSPASSAHSHRSIQSEALSQLSINPGVTSRKVRSRPLHWACVVYSSGCGAGVLLVVPQDALLMMCNLQVVPHPCIATCGRNVPQEAPLPKMSTHACMCRKRQNKGHHP